VSNHLAVAMVTSALSRTLSEALASGLPGGVQNAKVTTQRPQTLPPTDTDASGVNLFLYRVLSNGAWSAAELPARRGDGTLVSRPRQALDLHYLLTFYGDELSLEPQRLLGLSVSTLTVQPTLSRDVIAHAVDLSIRADPLAWEQYSDLADELDAVRLSLLPLDLEELSKLWSLFTHAPYRLSIVYQATVVLLDGQEVPAPPAKKVDQRVIKAYPAGAPPAVPETTVQG
jgi:hypothetical protein